MGDFQTFIKAVEDGNLEEARNSFQPDFLERADDFILKQRPIHYACLKGHLEVVKFLIQYNCELDCRTQNGKTPLEIAKKQGHKACENFLKEIQERRRKVFDWVRRNDAHALNELYSPAILVMEQLKTGFSILEAALHSNADEIIDYFLNKPVGAEELSALENYMKKCPRPDAVQLMEECLLYRSIRFHDADGFHLSCSAKTINEHGKLVKTSFLEVAAEFGCKPFIHSLLKKSVYNEEEWTKAKDLAILKEHYEIAEALSKRKILLGKRADKNFTWLHSAVCDNDPDMVKYILERYLVNPDSNNEVVGTGLALAHIMCYGDCVEVLENFKVDVNTQNKYSQSPLHEAIASGMTDHCSYLISRVQDIDKPGFMGFTGLQCAVMKGCEELCDQLVKNGADCVQYVEIPQQSPINKSAVLPISKRENAVTLCMKMHGTIYSCFLDVLDANKVNCSDGNENTLLHTAVKTLQSGLCKTLINCGANVGVINEQGNSPLLGLFSHFDHKVTDDNIDKLITMSNILIDSGADINEKGRSGMTVFESASQCNSERLMLYILSKLPNLQLITESDLKLAFTNQWFDYASALILIMSEDSAKSVISTDIFHLAMARADVRILKSMFTKASSDVQQSIIEDLLLKLSYNGEYEDFIKVLEAKINDPKLFPNGENLFTALLKEKKENFCRAVILHAPNRKYLNMTNLSKQIPLQVAIEADMYDLVCPLILKCDEVNNEDIAGNTPLKQLFEKLSNSTDIGTDTVLMSAIETIIAKGGDIYKETSTGIKNIEFCSRLPLRAKIEALPKIARNKDAQVIQGRTANNICNICLDKELDCVFDCGHTVCMTCGKKLFRCPMCNAEPTNPRRLYIN